MTLNPNLSTLQPKPQTLNPQPSTQTQNSQPHTPYPKPQTPTPSGMPLRVRLDRNRPALPRGPRRPLVHPTPCALHPKPQTLNPDPFVDSLLTHFARLFTEFGRLWYCSSSGTLPAPNKPVSQHPGAPVHSSHRGGKPVRVGQVSHWRGALHCTRHLPQRVLLSPSLGGGAYLAAVLVATKACLCW